MAFLGFGGGGLPVKQVRGNIQRGRDQAVNAVQQGSKTVQKTYDKGRNAVMEGKSQARSDLHTGVQEATPYLQQAADLYSPLADKYSGLAEQYGALAPGDLSARAMYLNALGLNGAQGNEAARGAFQASPGYQYQLDQALQSVMRNGAATGNTASGNVLMALQDRGNQLANQDWGNWLNRLSDQGNNIYQTYSGMGSAYGGLGNTIGGKANVLGSLSNLFENQGRGLAGIDTGTASQVNSSWMGQGGLLNSNNQSIAQLNSDRANNLSNLSLQDAAAKNAQQQALWSGALGLAGNLISAGGSAGGISRVFG